MTTIDITPKVKGQLDKLKEERGIKNYSDSIHFLLFFYETKKEKNIES